MMKLTSQADPSPQPAHSPGPRARIHRTVLFYILNIAFRNVKASRVELRPFPSLSRSDPADGPTPWILSSPRPFGLWGGGIRMLGRAGRQRRPARPYPPMGTLSPEPVRRRLPVVRDEKRTQAAAGLRRADNPKLLQPVDQAGRFRVADAQLPLKQGR